MTLLEVLDASDITVADMVVSDISGAETAILEAACGSIAERVRFLLLSTHHASISRHGDTHERCLSILLQCGAHVIAECGISESFSGNGLIAVSFDPRDRDMSVQVSLARPGKAIYPAPTGGQLLDAQRHAENLERSLSRTVEYATSLEAARAAAVEYAPSLEWHLAALQAGSEADAPTAS